MPAFALLCRSPNRFFNREKLRSAEAEFGVEAPSCQACPSNNEAFHAKLRLYTSTFLAWVHRVIIAYRVSESRISCDPFIVFDEVPSALAGGNLNFDRFRNLVTTKKWLSESNYKTLTWKLTWTIVHRNTRILGSSHSTSSVPTRLSGRFLFRRPSYEPQALEHRHCYRWHRTLLHQLLLQRPTGHQQHCFFLLGALLDDGFIFNEMRGWISGDFRYFDDELEARCEGCVPCRRLCDITLANALFGRCSRSGAVASGNALGTVKSTSGPDGSSPSPSPSSMRNRRRSLCGWQLTSLCFQFHCEAHIIMAVVVHQI